MLSKVRETSGSSNRCYLSTCAVVLVIVASLLLVSVSFFGGKITVTPQNCLQFGDLSSRSTGRRSATPDDRCDTAWGKKWGAHQAYIKQLENIEASRMSTIHQWNELRAYDLYEPEWVCASEVRVGVQQVNVGDGPKFVCAPDMLTKVDDCLVYSIGSNYDFQFEEGIRKHAPNCEFHTFDGTLDLARRALPGGLEEKNIHFHHWNLGVTSGVTEQGWTTKSLQDILTELQHKGRRIHVFKIDCEGCEYSVLPELAEYVISGQVFIDQIQVELHGTDASSIQHVFQNLRRANFAIFHKERNHWGCQGYKCVEFSLISEQRAKEVFEKEQCLEGSLSPSFDEVDGDEDDIEYGTDDILPIEQTNQEKQKQEELWWIQPYQQSVDMGPVEIKKFPYDIDQKNDVALVQLLCYAGGAHTKSTFIDIGLPTESLYFAGAGHRSEAFEARPDGYQSVKEAIENAGLQDLINLHQVALSNYSGETKIFEARDSSSIIETAVDVGPELNKRVEEGMRKTVVNVARLDDYVKEADAMKIDTQGAEPEIFMGARNVLMSGLPFPVLMEYCARLRNFDELSVGLHILRGLGYQCYARNALILDRESQFCGDFYCARDIQDRTCE